MQLRRGKPALISLTVLAVLGIFTFMALSRDKEAPIEEETPVETREAVRETIGYSVEGRAIEAYTYSALAAESRHLVFVGGIHGGYEWNSVLLAYETLDHLDENLDSIPDNITVTIIPSLNPDGVYNVLGIEGRFTKAEVPAGDASAGRFNANGVDLNRNFACKWQPESTWRGEVVSAGDSAFSEPEAAALRDFVLEQNPDAVVFWHSQSNAVYASECENGVLPDTLTLMNTYASAAGYPAVESFDHYPITGDAEGWLASIGIPAITVELSTHETVEWEQNLAGVKALFEHYGNI